MKKLSNILNSGLLGRNGALLCAIVALVLTGLFAASCAKSEIAQDESIANAAAAGAAGEGQDDSAGDNQGNPDDPNPGDPSNPDGPVQPGDDYISPDHFNMVQMTFGACADAEDNPSQPAQAGSFGTKGLFTPEEAASREEFLDDEPRPIGAMSRKRAARRNSTSTGIRGTKSRFITRKASRTFRTVPSSTAAALTRPLTAGSTKMTTITMRSIRTVRPATIPLKVLSPMRGTARLP